MPSLKNPKHELFAQGLANGEDVGKAYEAAGFKKNDGNARRFKQNEAIRKRVEALLSERQQFQAKAIEVAIEKTGISIGKVLEELARIGFSNIADYVDTSGDHPSIRLCDVPRDKLAALSEITTETVFERTNSKGAPTEVRRVKIKLWDKKGALVDIGRHLGMFKDRVEHTGKDGAPLPAAAVTIFQLPDNGRS